MGDNGGSIPFVDLGAQYQTIRGEIDAAVAAVISRSDFILGEEVELLEEEFASYCGVEFGVGVDSGTSALSLALRAVGVGAGDEVITVANTFIATAAAISHTGARPVLVDMEPSTYQMDIAQLEAAIGSRTAAIVPVHLYGHPVDLDAVLQIANSKGLPVVEDAAQAHGALYRGSRVGSFGRAAAFSFYPGKNLGAFGDAGMVVTNDPDVADRIRLDRNHGSRKKYVHQSVGFNNRLDTIQAAVLRAKLPHLDDWNGARRHNASVYDGLLKSVAEVRLSERSPLAQPVHHLYPIRIADRDALQARLGAAGVSTVIHYPIPVHLQDAYASLGYRRGAFPETELHADEVLSLPMFAELTDTQIGRICDIVATHFS